MFMSGETMGTANSTKAEVTVREPVVSGEGLVPIRSPV